MAINDEIYIDNGLTGLSAAASGFPRNQSLVVESALGASPTAAQINSALVTASTAAGSGDPHVVTCHGTITINTTLALKNRSVLRVTPGQTGRIETSNAMTNMVSFNGSSVQSRTCTLTGSFNSRTATLASDPSGQIGVGIWQLGTNSSNGPGGQQVEITAVNGTTLTLAEALAQDFTGINMGQMDNETNWRTTTGLEGFTLAPLHNVTNLIGTLGATDFWIVDTKTEGTQQVDGNDIPIVGAVGQQSSAIYLRQSYRFLIDQVELDNAAEHGDGGQGYGINNQSHSSMGMIRLPVIRHMRHSILMGGGSSGCTVDSPHTSLPFHPNFPNGGATEFSFHGYCSGITVINPNVGRIMLRDAGQPGRHNTLVKCVLRDGPLTLDGTDTNQLTNVAIIQPDVQGNVAALRSRVMPSLNTASTAGEPSPPRPWWFGSYNSGTGEYDPGAITPDPFTQTTDAIHSLGDGIYLPNPSQVDTASVYVSNDAVSSFPALAWWSTATETPLLRPSAWFGAHGKAAAQSITHALASNFASLYALDPSLTTESSEVFDMAADFAMQTAVGSSLVPMVWLEGDIAGIFGLSSALDRVKAGAANMTSSFLLTIEDKDKVGFTNPTMTGVVTAALTTSGGGGGGGEQKLAYWNGSAWVFGDLKVRGASTWDDVTPNAYSGSTWE